MSEQREKLVEIFATILELEESEIDDNLSPATLDRWDSLNHVNLCTAVGEEFGLEMTTDQMLEIRSFGDVVQLVQNK